MSRELERLDAFAARDKWILIGSWMVIGFLVITSTAILGRDLKDAHEAPGRAVLFDGWYPRIDAPSKGRAVLDTSGHRPHFDRLDDFLDYLTDVVVPSTSQARGHDVAWRRERRPQP